MEHEMTQAQRCEMRHERRVVGHASGRQELMDTCVCGAPWPCTGRTQEPSVDVRRPMAGFEVRRYHDAALSSLRTELVAARAEIERLKATPPLSRIKELELWNARFQEENAALEESLSTAISARDAEIATLRAENEKLKADNSEAISTMTSYYDRIQRLEEANRVLLHRLDAKPGNPFPWGEVFRRHLAKGEDHGSAAYAADRAEARANQGRGK